MRLLVASVPIWAALLGIQIGWGLHPQSGGQDPVRTTFGEHLDVQRLARQTLPDKPDPKAYAVLKWEVPEK